VFVPVAFMGGLARQWFKPFALTIACSVLVSLFVSFSLDPMLSAYWPDPHRGGAREGVDHPQARPLQPLVRPPAEDYKGVIAWALDHRAAMVAIAAGAFFGALMIPVKGISAFLAVMAISLLVAAFTCPLKRWGRWPPSRRWAWC
jgi:HAE1 family hydrophobic/amphiphilic exporter-1